MWEEEYPHVRKPSRWCILGSKIPQPAHALPVLLQLSAAVCRLCAGEQVICEECRQCWCWPFSLFFPLSGCNSVVLTRLLFVTKFINQLCYQSVILPVWHKSFQQNPTKPLHDKYPQVTKSNWYKLQPWLRGIPAEDCQASLYLLPGVAVKWLVLETMAKGAPKVPQLFSAPEAGWGGGQCPVGSVMPRYHIFSASCS